MKLLPASPWDYITSTKDGAVRFDPRKTWEAGAFLISAWGFIYLTLHDKLTEAYFVGFMATWAAARFLRDREQRLSKPAG